MRASDFNIKKRDPNWKTLQAKRTSNAAGAHKDKKKADKNGDTKHKNKEVAEVSQAYRDAMAKSREAEINFRADNAERRLAKKAAEPKTIGQKIKKDIGGPLKKLAKGDIKGALGVNEGVSYGTMPAEAVRTLLHVYQDASNGVRQHHDAEGANRIGQELASAAKELGVSQHLRSLFNAASHSAHMDFDTNPGDFKNWFTYVGDHLQALYKIHQEKGSYDNDEPDTHPDEEKMSERFRDPEDWDEGNTEPANNFAVYINGKKWKVFKGRGYYADDFRERQHYQQLKAWADKKSAATGKKWSVHTTGEPATE